ncbi:hypothetical protein JTP67_37040, partial [Streptomyces sp. S12]|nr:hypothetical protein [Streptomyces sp. S12]
APTEYSSAGKAQAKAAVDFQSGNLGANDDQRLNALGLSADKRFWGTSVTVSSDDIVAYLRGTQSKEQSNKGPLRTRSTAFGDIINSAAEVVSPRADYGYGLWSSM